MKHLRMRGSLVLVKRREQPLTVAGVALAAGMKSQAEVDLHEVVAVGPDVEGMVRPGQLAVMDRPGGTPIRFNGEDLMVYRLDQVAAVAE